MAALPPQPASESEIRHPSSTIATDDTTTAISPNTRTPSGPPVDIKAAEYDSVAPNILPTAHHVSVPTDPDIEKRQSTSSSHTDQNDHPLEHSAVEEAAQAYTIWTHREKVCLALSAALGALLSPMTGAIYYPAITTISHDLGVSNDDINLTITTYMVVQAIAPMLVAGFSDDLGRRPAYVLCFGIYLAANLGLALQNSYVALLILRMLQSAGSSALIALGQGTIADVVTSSERGRYTPYSSIPTVVGPTLGPVIGGLLSTYLGWHSVFWFLLIVCAILAFPLLLFLPETCRNVVGDGSIPPPFLNQNLTDTIRHARRAKRGLKPDPVRQAALRANLGFRIPNPLKTLTVLADLESLLVLIGSALSLMMLYVFSTGASLAFKDIYHYNELYVSLMFLPFGGAGLLSILTTGPLMDWNFRRLAAQREIPLNHTRQMDLSAFPIEKARLQLAIPVAFLGASAQFVYGWLIARTYGTRFSIAGPVCMLMVAGYGCSATCSIMIALLLDLNSTQPATATAANNLVRCTLGAAAAAALGLMTSAWGNGWGYGFWSLLFMAYIPVMGLVSWKGLEWRQKRSKKLAAKAEVKRMKE